MSNMGHEIAGSMVAEILERYGIEPALGTDCGCGFLYRGSGGSARAAVLPGSVLHRSTHAQGLACKPVALLGVAAGAIGAIKSLEALRGVVQTVRLPAVHSRTGLARGCPGQLTSGIIRTQSRREASPWPRCCCGIRLTALFADCPQAEQQSRNRFFRYNSTNRDAAPTADSLRPRSLQVES